jgi:hypothetical protein
MSPVPMRLRLEDAACRVSPSLLRRDAARIVEAVLAELRNPSEEMVLAGWRANPEPAAIFQLMIDEAGRVPK